MRDLTSISVMYHFLSRQPPMCRIQNAMAPPAPPTPPALLPVSVDDHVHVVLFEVDEDAHASYRPVVEGDEVAAVAHDAGKPVVYVSLPN